MRMISKWLDELSWYDYERLSSETIQVQRSSRLDAFRYRLRTSPGSLPTPWVAGEPPLGNHRTLAGLLQATEPLPPEGKEATESPWTRLSELMARRRGKIILLENGGALSGAAFSDFGAALRRVSVPEPANKPPRQFLVTQDGPGFAKVEEMIPGPHGGWVGPVRKRGTAYACCAFVAEAMYGDRADEFAAG